MTQTQKSQSEQLQGCHVMPGRMQKDDCIVTTVHRRQPRRESQDEAQNQCVPSNIGTSHQECPQARLLFESSENTSHPTGSAPQQSRHALEHSFQRARQQSWYDPDKDTISQHIRSRSRLSLFKATLIDDYEVGMRMVESRIRISAMIEQGFD